MVKFLLRKIRKDLKEKKGDSLMLSYVLLIFIVTALWISVYAWMKISANISPAVNCKDETSVILISSCEQDSKLFLKIRNNGRFNVDGIIAAVGDNPIDIPVTYLKQYSTGSPGKAVIPGHFIFDSSLKPGEEKEAIFLNEDSEDNLITLSDIKNIQIQPFIFDKKTRIVCQNAIIRQEVEIAPC